jgi:hypothetical protein
VSESADVNANGSAVLVDGHACFWSDDDFWIASSNHCATDVGSQVPFCAALFCASGFSIKSSWFDASLVDSCHGLSIYYFSECFQFLSS